LQSRGQQGSSHFEERCVNKQFIIYKGQWEPSLPLTAALGIANSKLEKKTGKMSLRNRSVAPFRFKQLWENHPVITGEVNPCCTNGKPNFHDQCAIRLGTALAACGVNTTKLPGVRHCWQHDKKYGHTLSAEELAKSLKDWPVYGVGAFQAIEPSEFSKKISGMTGIIFFKDYWQRTVNGKKEIFRAS